MKTTKPKPRVMWANYYPAKRTRWPIVHGCRKNAKSAVRTNGKTVRVAVIPLDDVEAIVERAAKAMWKELHGRGDDMNGPAIAALTTAGIPCKQRRARK